MKARGAVDPDANLKEQIEKAGLIILMRDRNERASMIADEADRLAELVRALDEWIVGGGFLPARWRKP